MNQARIDPLTLSVVRHKLQAIAEEMAHAMASTCFSAILNLNQDFSSVILDAKSRILAQAERLPIHMGAMPWAVRAMAESFAGDIGPDDVFMSNDPYFGGSHLPDITVAKPFFRDGELRMWVALRAHHGDIGGIAAGGFSPTATEIWHEGVRIPPVKLVENGRLRVDVLRMVTENTRKPDDFAGDLHAQLAAVGVGVERLERLFERYGTDAMEECGEAILDAGEAAMAREITGYRPGTYEGVGYVETGDREGPLPIPVRITVGEGALLVDLTGCPDQVTSIINSPIANTTAAVICAFMYLCRDEPSVNGGSERLIRVLTRKGSVVDPVPPAPVVCCTTMTSSVIIEAVLKSMAPACPDVAIAGFNRRFRFAISSIGRDDKPFIWHYFFNRGGGGASAVADGWPNLGGFHNPGSMPAPSIEHTERAYPLFIEEYSLRPDSAGAGRKRGGLGGRIRIRYEGDHPGILNAVGDGVNVPPFGIEGGRDGAGHAYHIERADGTIVPLGIRASDLRLARGDVLVCLSAGGGGYGPPEERSAEEIERDRRFGYVAGQDSGRVPERARAETEAI